METENSHLVWKNPDLFKCWLAGTNKKRFTKSDEMDNIKELCVGHFCNEALARVECVLKSRKNPSRKPDLSVSMSNLWHTTGDLLLGIVNIHEMQVNVAYEEAKDLMQKCQRNLDFSMPTQSKNKTKAGKLPPVEFKLEEIDEAAISTEEFLAQFENNNCVPEKEITLKPTEHKTDYNQYSEEMMNDFPELDDSEYEDMFNMVMQNRGHGNRTVYVENSVIESRRYTIETSTPIRGKHNSGSYRSYLSKPHTDHPSISEPNRTQPNVPSSDEDIFRMSEDIPQANAETEPDTDLSDLPPPIVTAKKTSKNKKSLKIDTVKEISFQEQIERGKLMYAECALPDFYGPVVAKLQKGRRLSISPSKYNDIMNKCCLSRAPFDTPSDFYNETLMKKDLKSLFQKPANLKLEGSPLIGLLKPNLETRPGQNMYESILDTIRNTSTNRFGTYDIEQRAVPSVENDAYQFEQEISNLEHVHPRKRLHPKSGFYDEHVVGEELAGSLVIGESNNQNETNIVQEPTIRHRSEEENRSSHNQANAIPNSDENSLINNEIVVPSLMPTITTTETFVAQSIPLSIANQNFIVPKDSELFKFIVENKEEFRLPNIDPAVVDEINLKKLCLGITLEPLRHRFTAPATFQKLMWFWLRKIHPIGMGHLNSSTICRLSAAKSFAALLTLKKKGLITIASGINNNIIHISKGEALRHIF